MTSRGTGDSTTVRRALPAPVTSFVGREELIAEITARLKVARLITLTGPGGVGKTRLALQVASAVSAGYPDGVWLVNLENLTDPSLLGDTVSAALGVSHHPSQEIEEQLGSYLAGRRSLIVLDNCEHLLDSVAELSARLLAGAAGLSILATSRSALEIAGEHTIAVAPLSVPMLPTEGRAVDLESLAGEESVRLLVDRARAHDAEFALSPSNAKAVARLCIRLEGLPLTIELAANRLRALSVDQLLDRLEDRFAVLSGTVKGTPRRQQTLRALIDWSFELCTEEQQVLWARMSVFSGPFDLAAVESVCAAADLPEHVILDLVDQLVAQSVLIAVPIRDEMRYRMLETVREYGRDRLRSDEGSLPYRRRHRDFYLTRARSHVDAWAGPGQAAALAQLRADHQNLRSALEWSVAIPREHTRGMELACALRFHWVVNGRLSEGRRWLSRFLDANTAPSEQRAEALWIAAWAAVLQGAVEAAEEALGECRRIVASLSDKPNEAYAVLMQATVEYFTGSMAQAVESFDTAAKLSEENGDNTALLLCLFQNSIALTHTGKSERAKTACERALTLSEQLGEKWSRAYVLWAMGVEEWQHGSAVAAERHCLTALQIADVLRDRVCLGLVLDALACIAVTRKDAMRAAVLLGIADASWEPLGTTIGAFGLHLAGHHITTYHSAENTLGAERFAEFFALGRQREQSSSVAWVLSGLQIDGRADAVRRRPDDPRTRLTRREREVADLLAKGMSNREMADRLVLSLRTIEGHMENILSKLGCSSRGQVIALLAQDIDRKSE